MSTISTVAAEHYQIKGFRNNHKDKCAEPETVDDNDLHTDWPDNVNNGAKYADHRQEIMDTVAEVQEISRGRLGRICMPDCHIELTKLDIPM